MELTPIQQAIIKTVSHFDVMDYPLTLIELFRGLSVKTDLMTLKTELDKLVDLRIITVETGFYFLSGRETILQIRHRHYRLFLKKIKVAERYIYCLNKLPWIKAVAIYNSLSYKYAKVGSDIDLFIITTANRVWSARFVINIILKILKLRPKNNNSDNKLCPSYWIDETELNISNFAFEADYSYEYYLNHFTFLTGDNKIIENFFLTNSWLREKFPNWQPINFIRKIIFNKQNLLKQLAELIFGLIPEKIYKKIQLKILPKSYFLNNDNKKVVLTNRVIKLHDKDKRQEYNLLFQENYAATLAKIQNPIA
jgi:hypothetical protein